MYKNSLGSRVSKDAIIKLQEQIESSTSTDAITEPSEQSGSNISIDAGTDCKYMVNFALPSRQSGERQSTSVQSPSESDISKSPPAKQKKK